ncbi:MAG: HAD family hydrolase [Candidatus Binataceae bacterium]
MGSSDTTLRLDPSSQLWMFDFDNTLVALEETVDWAASRQELEPMLRGAGCPAELLVEFPRGNLVLYDAILHRLREGRFTPELPARELLQRASDIIESFELAGVDRAQPLPGAGELLIELAQRHVPVAIVTSNSSRTVYRWLARARLVPTVRIVAGRDTFLPLKPAPDMLKRALDHCKADANTALFVGDSDADLKAARAAGLRFVAIASNQQARSRMRDHRAEPVFASPAELLRTIKVD